MKIIALVHLAELYLKKKKEEELEAIIPEIQAGINLLDSYDKPEAFKARNFIGLSLMNKGKLK